jgi:adenine-specific DNA-methyltransferase
MPPPLRLFDEAAPTSVIRCEDNLTFMRSLPDESIHLVVTSPPYNIGKEYEENVLTDL